MTKARRRRPKPGSYLTPVEASGLVECDAWLSDLHRTMTGQGYVLTKTVRPYLTKRRIVTLRFVWRRRDKGISVALIAVQRLPVGAILDAR